MIAQDLASEQWSRIAIWQLYFDRAAEGTGRPGENDPTYDEVIAACSKEYQEHESPGRSNYFAAIIAALSAKQQSVGLGFQQLTNHLGAPDRQSTSTGKTRLQYDVDVPSGIAVAIVTVTNTHVASIIVMPGTSSAGSAGKFQHDGNATNYEH